MRIYDGQDIRNVALVGHGDTGKTQLVSALLYAAGMVNRLGKVDDGTSTTDYDEEEIQRKFSITAGLAYAEWGRSKINFIDTPGYNILCTKRRGRFWRPMPLYCLFMAWRESKCKRRNPGVSIKLILLLPHSA